MSKTEYFTVSSPPTDRTLAYSFFGSKDPSAPVVFYFHGYPSSHPEGGLLHAAALQHNVRLLAITRPGYGESTPLPGRTLLEWPKDVLALADHLKIEKFGVIGVSGGGPYVFAALHAMPKERLLGAAILCGMYPPEFGYAGMNFKHRFMINAATWSPGFVTWMLRGAFGNIASKEAEGGNAVEEFLDGEMKSLPPVDQTVWSENRGGFRETMVKATGTMVRNAAAAETTALEAGLYGSPWGFDISEIEYEGRLAAWHGTADFNVGCASAREAGRILGERVELTVLEGEAHGSLVVRAADEAMAWVVGKMNASG